MSAPPLSDNFALGQLASDLAPYFDGVDATAIHVDEADEIHGITAATPVAADVIVLEDASDDWNKKSATIGSIPIAQAQVASGARIIAEDGAVAFVNTDHTILWSVDDANITATTVSSYAGQTITVRLVEIASEGTGTLTIAATDKTAGDVVLAAEGDWVTIVRISTAWHVVASGIAD